MRVDLGQALFGYDRGHRLIASSVRLDRDDQWVLRAVTDMKFGPDTERCLTILPVATAGFDAFIRTWRAPKTFRPGSVWSHAILVPVDMVNNLGDFGFLDHLFRRPTLETPDQLAVVQTMYEQPLSIDAPERPTPVDGPEDLLDALVAATYGDAPGEVRAQDLATAERVLLGLVAQQSPSLRASFAARTRHRLSASSVAQFHVQVVERPSGKVSPTRAARTEWSGALVADLRNPDPEFRSFLATYGSAPSTTRATIRTLVDLFLVLSSGSVQSVSDFIQQHFPKASSMRGLKRDLYGPTGRERLGAWPSGESDRLTALLGLRPGTIDYKDLAVGHRLEQLLVTSPGVAHSIVAPIDWMVLQGEGRLAVVDALTTAADTNLLVSVVSEHPNLGVELLSNRPDTWVAPETWESLGNDVVTDLVLASDPPIRGDVFRGLLIDGMAGPAAALQAKDPQLWWAILDPDHVSVIAHDKGALRLAGGLLRDSGSNRIGQYPPGITTADQALVLAATSAPDDRLWQQAPASLWIDVINDRLADTSLDDPDAGLMIVALAAAERDRSADARRRAWSLVFGRLHALLEGAGPPENAVQTLRTVAPGRPSWDWCGRLREGLAREAVKDDWSASELAAVAAGAGGHAGDVLRRAASMEQPDGGSVVHALRKILNL